MKFTVLLALLGATKTLADETMLLNTVPFIMAHDAGSGYLSQEQRKSIKNLVYGWTQTQSGGLGEQLSCGARAFDARPAVNDDGDLVWHHGDVTVNHSFSESIDEVIKFCAENPTELVIMTIWDCTGDGCDDAVDSVFANLDVVPVTSCGVFENLTLGDARVMGSLSTGGQFLVVHSPSEASCSFSNYDPSIACSGFNEGHLATLPDEIKVCLLSTKDLATNKNTRTSLEEFLSVPLTSLSLEAQSALQECLNSVNSIETPGSIYRCYDGDPSSSFPLDRMRQYLDNTSTAFAAGDAPASSNGQLWQMQALWQESVASVVLGTLVRSSLLEDESRSSWNVKLSEDVLGGRWKTINLLEVNNVCDGGPELYEALANFPSS